MSAFHPNRPVPVLWWVEWRSAGEQHRILLGGRLRVGRSAAMDVVIDDPYVSREHCVLELEGGGVRIDASRSLNRIWVQDGDFDRVFLTEPGSFRIGETTIGLRPVSPNEDTTLHLTQRRPALTLRHSTRELLDPDGTVIAQLSVSEETALYEMAIKYPDAVDHDTLGRAIWGKDGFDRYLIHRVVQRLRDRMGDSGDLIENVRGAGYRLRAPLDLR
jgi:hypothetical protein